MTNHEQFDDKSDLPIESNDDAVLRMLAGASFGPDARIILPSGTELSGDEAQVFTSAFSSQEHVHATTKDYVDNIQDPSESSAYDRSPERDKADNPLDSKYDRWTGDPQIDRDMLIERARAAVERHNPRTSISSEQEGHNSSPQSKSKNTSKKRWWKRNSQ